MNMKTKFSNFPLGKKTIISLLVLSAFMLSVSAINQPPTGSIPGAPEPPVAPGTGTEGECEPYEITGRYCDGEMAFYTQCTQSVSGGKWKDFSINCAQYEKVCSMGKCVKPSEAGLLGISWTVIGIIAIIIFIIWIISRRK